MDAEYNIEYHILSSILLTSIPVILSQWYLQPSCKKWEKRNSYKKLTISWTVDHAY